LTWYVSQDGSRIGILAVELHLDGYLMTETSSLTSVYQARGITKVYRMGEVEVHALRGVDLDLFEGEFIVLLGPSGSGKSTLLNILGGLDIPTSGSVSYRGQDLTKDDDALLTKYRRDHVGFVFQFYRERGTRDRDCEEPDQAGRGVEVGELGASHRSLSGSAFWR